MVSSLEVMFVKRRGVAGRIVFLVCRYKTHHIMISLKRSLPVGSRY